MHIVCIYLQYIRTISHCFIYECIYIYRALSGKNEKEEKRRDSLVVQAARNQQQQQQSAPTANKAASLLSMGFAPVAAADR